MSGNQSAVQKIRRARFETQITGLMQQRQPHEHQMMQAFAKQSAAFVKLREDVIDHYYFEQPQLSPLFCVDAVTRLVQQVLSTMQSGLQEAA